MTCEERMETGTPGDQGAGHLADLSRRGRQRKLPRAPCLHIQQPNQPLFYSRSHAIPTSSCPISPLSLSDSQCDDILREANKKRREAGKQSHHTPALSSQPLGENVTTPGQEVAECRKRSWKVSNSPLLQDKRLQLAFSTLFTPPPLCPFPLVS